MTDDREPGPDPTPSSSNDGPSDGASPTEERRPARAGRKASQAADESPRRARTSALDPWKKAREKAAQRLAEEENAGDTPRQDEGFTPRPRRSPSESPERPTFRRRRNEGPSEDGPRRAERRPEGLDRGRSTGDRDRGRPPEGRGDRPRRRRDDRPDRERGDRFGRDRADERRDRPHPGRRRNDGPRGERPRGERPRGERPRGERPRDERFRADRSRGERPQGGRPQGGRPRGDRPRDERFRSDRSRDRDERRPDRRDRSQGPRHGRRDEQAFGQTRGPREQRQEQDERQRSPQQVKAGVRLSEVEELELKIEKLIYGGDGFARFDGIPIFVPRSAPGDKVRVRLTERKLGYGRAEILEILEPGPGRREPPCPHFARCGGCDLQHLDDSSQLRLKAETVVETLRRIGKISPPSKFDVVAGDSLGYRLRTQIHLATTDRGLEIGYFARGSHDLVPTEQCPVLVPQLEAQLADLPRRLDGATHARIDLAAGDGGTWAVAPPFGDLPKGELEVKAAGFRYTYDARCFFQGHQGLVSDLVAHAVGDYEDPDGEAFDLFGGVGLFSLPLSRKYKKVTSVEGDRVASRYARRNAKHNGCNNVEVTSQSVESWIDELPVNATRILVDPPRVGLSDKVRRKILARKPLHITYVACEPPTLARDLKEMTRFYSVDSLTLIDMFPQTGHMECVVQLSLTRP